LKTNIATCLSLHWRRRWTYCNDRADRWQYLFSKINLNIFSKIIGEHVDLAKKYKALIFAVEHRFYGESLNDDGLELKNLQYLSSQEA
jgi:hypothetical protein